MTTSTAVPGLLVARSTLRHLSAVLERYTGDQAPALLREIGFASGSECYDRYAAYCRDRYRVEFPQELDLQFLNQSLTEFFEGAGWGDVTTATVAPGVLAFDSDSWAEAEPGIAELPNCHFASGLLAEFFTRLGHAPAAVMEVECRSRGDGHCRFLVAAPDTLNWLYEQMVAGTPYDAALQALAAR
jgi:predicted hydrocarbon binding protein